MTLSSDLGKQIEIDIAYPSRVLMFSAMVENQYQDDIHRRRKRHIYRSHVTAFFAYNSFLLCEWLMLKDIFFQAILWHLFCASLPTLACLFTLKKTNSYRLREVCAWLPCLAGFIAAVAIILSSSSPDRALCLFSLPLILIYANNTTALPFRYALPFTILVLPIIVGCAFTVNMTFPQGLFATCIALVTGAFSLLANFWLERSERYSYLLNLREKLRVQSLSSTNRTLQTLSDTDSLTGIANRRYFVAQLDDLWNRYEAGGAPFSLLILDVDHFKRFNDLYGHPAGDNCLQCIVSALREQLREVDLLARYGGEEFAVLLPNCTLEQAHITAERLRAAIETLGLPHQARGDELLIVSISIGAACSDQESPQPDDQSQLIEFADRALYRAKRLGRNQIALASRADSQLFETPDGLPELKPADLRRALDEGRLYMQYHSIHDCSSTEVVGYEALLRWDDPARGLISPNFFIPLAERSGFILELGEWALRTACHQAVQWPKAYSLSVNVSPLQFADPNFAARVAEVLRETKLAPSRLILELTEGVPLNITPQVRETFATLQASGIRLSLDDYCTGHSNIAYLLALPFNTVKIDSSIIQVEDADKRRALLKSLVDMSRAFGARIIAEGIETQEHLDLLCELGCDLAQGFFLAEPLLPEALAHQHARWTAERAAL
ncbi:bifunctional diguanylate cyclase/phosphodiesterase [Pseudomonas luteola]|uniref:putative bifunctional diguanylate cyclase/phosphodiesterase n=1 Tax=Pseudomonas TaxID=286 RepID=UPI003DA16841